MPLPDVWVIANYKETQMTHVRAGRLAMVTVDAQHHNAIQKEPDMSAPSPAGPSAAAVNAIKEKAKLLSIYSMMATTAAGSGHPTSCMSAAELVAGVFFYAMKLDPKNANSNQNDRFVLSKGHAAPLLYAALAEAGVFPVSRLMTLREFTSELEGHPTPRISWRGCRDRVVGTRSFGRLGPRDRRANG